MHAFEIHAHTSEHSACSHMTAEELIARAAELGLAGVVVTDHHYQWPQAHLQDLTDKATGGAVAVLSAYELTTSVPGAGGHMCDWITLRGMTAPG